MGPGASAVDPGAGARPPAQRPARHRDRQGAPPRPAGRARRRRRRRWRRLPRGDRMILLERPEHGELRTAVRKLLEQEAPIERIGDEVAGDGGDDPRLWRRVAQEIGVAGLGIPGRFGGAGASAQEDAVVAEELGRSLARTPYLSTVALAANVLLASGDESACATYLPAIAAGELTATVAYRAGDGAVGASRVPVSAV